MMIMDNDSFLTCVILFIHVVIIIVYDSVVGVGGEVNGRCGCGSCDLGALKFWWSQLNGSVSLFLFLQPMLHSNLTMH